MAAAGQRDVYRAQNAAYRVGSFTLDLDRKALLKAEGAEVPLRPKSFSMLLLLVENAGRTLSKDAIISSVWPGLIVTENNITQCVHEIRNALGAEAQQILRTRPRHGYQIAADVVAIPSAPPPGISTRFGVSPTIGPHQQVSVSRMPVTGGLLVGRDEELRQLDQLWNTPHCNIVTLVAWAGVGKSTLVNHWVRRMARDGYRGADRVFAWSFYRQGTVDRVMAADEFIEASLTWFGDAVPNKGSPRDKGARLAKLMQQCRTLLILDGLEPLQSPPGPNEGTLKDDGLHTLVCELASFNAGLCVITTRLHVADLLDFQDNHQQLNLSCLSSRDGATLLRANTIEGSDLELEQASDEFGGHCFALTLLSNYLNDAYHGDVKCRHHVRALHDDVRQGNHAKRVLNSYIEWIDDVAELEVLRLIGLFDRPAAPGAVQALRACAIPQLTKEIHRLSDEDFKRVVSRLRRAGLLTERDVQTPDALDAHPLIRQFFREQLQTEFARSWYLGNECLFRHFQVEAKALPESLAEMEALFQAVVFGCNAGLQGEAFREVYMPRIMRGERYYAANVLGARGALLSMLSHFFESKSWDNLIRAGLEPQEQLTILQHVRMLLTATMGYNMPGAIRCYQAMKSLCDSIGDGRSLYSAMTSDWMHALVSKPLNIALRGAEEILALGIQENDPAMKLGAYRSLSDTTFFMGDFRRAKGYAESGVELWNSGVSTAVVHDEVSAPIVTCMCFDSLALWQLGDPSGALRAIEKAVDVANSLAHAHSLAVALHFEGYLGHFCGRPARTEATASRLISLSQENGFHFWLAGAYVQLGWARTVLGAPNEGLPLIAEGQKLWRATRAELITPYWAALSVEAHFAAGSGLECLPMIDAACESADARGEQWWKADLLRLKGCHAIEQGDLAGGAQWLNHAARLAREQGALSLLLRANLEIGRLLSQAGCPETARELICPAYEAINHGPETKDLKSAMDFLAVR